jgi:acyl-CoA dehydrogenase
VTEATVMAQAIAESGAGMSGASAIHINIFGLNPVVVFGTEEQKRRMLPPMADRGQVKACFAVTEPDAGLNTTKLKTRAVRKGDRYVVNGQKVWISTAQVADKMLLLARTTPIDEVRKPDRGAEPLLHRLRPQPHRGARDREDGPQGGRLERAVHRRT